MNGPLGEPDRTLARRAFGAVAQAPMLAVVGLVRLYQIFLSPIFGRQCRYQPTCSHYFLGALEKYGLLRGAWKGLRRIGRCHPWGGHGYDPP